MKTVSQKQLNQIKAIVNSTRLISDRKKRLESAGFNVGEFPMGSGGVLQIKEMKDEIRVQVSYGVSRHNYALAVVFRKQASITS